MRCGDRDEPGAIRVVSTVWAGSRPFSFAFNNRHGPPFACILKPLTSPLNTPAQTQAP